MSFKLNKLNNFAGREGPLLLIIMDGVGIAKEYDGNAVYKANTPTLDKLFKSELYTQLQAHGTAVGLPADDDMGNSEVGHNALGAGRVFAQGAKRVGIAINDKSIFATDTWKKIVEQCTDKSSTLHFIGLLSDGNVHSHIDHLIAMLKQAKNDDIKTVRLHILLDGRDVYEKSALEYINKLETILTALSINGFDYRIASGGGRMVTTMDRYFADWSVVERGWKAHVLGDSRQFSSATKAIETYYKEDETMTDQYLDSFVIAKDDKPIGTVEDNDCVIFFNFRGDRAIEISMAFEKDDFDGFDRVRVPNIIYAGMMEYDGDLHIPSTYLVEPPEIDRTMGKYICEAKIKSFAISETQKFGHVTYFWNGNKSGYICKDLETYVEIPSDKIQFDKAPKMKALEITAKVKEMLKSGEYKYGRLNFANGDMVGHTGIMKAAVEAMETVDACVGELIELVKSMNGITIITADHGNCDEMWTEKNGKRSPKTSHTLNPVPFIIVDPLNNGDYIMAEIVHTGLANVAATVFNLLGYEAPEGYESSLVKFK